MNAKIEAILEGVAWRPGFRAAAGALVPGPLFAGQARLLRDSRVAHGESALIIAPTGSGKSVVGWLAMLAACAQGRIGMLLAPTRALAEEAAAALAPAAAEAGLRLALTAREHRASDEDIRAGDVDMIVAVYEKAFALLRESSRLAARVGCLALDEVQILFDAERGAGIEMGLLRLLEGASPRPAIVGLAAHLPAAQSLSAWLRIPIVRSEERPVPLREGVFDLSSGTCLWRAADGTEVESLTPPCIDLDEPAALAETITNLLPVSGGTIIFVPTRKLAWELAQSLARAAARPFGPAMREVLPPGLATDVLSPLVDVGIAVHTSELPRAHRAFVERAFRAGELRVVVSTPTLAQGVNLNASLVLHWPCMPAARVDGADGGALAPLSAAAFSNAGGRAGRPGSPGPGRSIALAFSGDERRRLADALFGAPVANSLEPPATPTTLEVLATLFDRDGAAEGARLRRMGAARIAHVCGPDIDMLLEEGTRIGLWRSDAGALFHLGGAGRTVARGGGRAHVVSRWARLLWGCADEASPLSVLMLACEGISGFLGTPNERSPRAADAPAWRRLLTAPDALARARCGMHPPGPSTSLRVLVVETLLGPGGMRDAEARFGLLGGTLEELSAECAHQLALLEGLAEYHRRPAIQALALRMREALRGDCAKPARAESPAPAPAPPPTAPASIAASANRRAASTRLEFVDPSTGHVRFDARDVFMAPLQYEFLCALVENLESGVAKTDMVLRLWGSQPREEQQLFYHRTKIETALLGHAPQPAGELIATMPRWGFRLLLSRGEIARAAERVGGSRAA